MRAISERTRNGACVDVHTVSASPTGSHAASAQRGSIGTPASRFCSTVSSTTRAAPAKAASGSPARHVWPSERFPGASSQIFGAALPSATWAIATPGSGAYSTATSAAPSHAASGDSATTAATGVP